MAQLAGVTFPSRVKARIMDDDPAAWWCRHTSLVVGLGEPGSLGRGNQARGSYSHSCHLDTLISCFYELSPLFSFSTTQLNLNQHQLLIPLHSKLLLLLYAYVTVPCYGLETYPTCN